MRMLIRLATALDTSHMLKNMLVFGATSDKGFIFIGERCLPKQRWERNIKTLRLFRIGEIGSYVCGN
jgi:hypothetical protein